MVTPDWLKANAYRVLGLAADAGPARVHARATTLRRSAALGIEAPDDADLVWLGHVERSETDIRAAVGRLENPTQRLLDRLFWYHREQTVDDLTDHGAGTEWLAAHDAALKSLLLALAAADGEAAFPLWNQALKAWHAIVAQDGYWQQIQAIELEADFEPAALPSEVDELRERAVAIAASPLIGLGAAALETGNMVQLSRATSCLAMLSYTGAWSTLAVDEIVEPALNPFLSACASVRDQLTNSVTREAGSAAQNAEPCAAGLKRYRQEIEPSLERLLAIIPRGCDARIRVSEAAASLLAFVAAQITWTDDFITAERLYSEALDLARDTMAAFQIEQALDQIRESVRVQRLIGKPIQTAPSLFTYNGIGLALYGGTDHDQQTASYVATHYFVVLGIPIFPVGRYRVIRLSDGRYRFLGKHPFRSVDRWWQGLAAAALTFVCRVGGNSKPSTATNYSPSSTSSDSSGTVVSTDTGAPADAAPASAADNSAAAPAPPDAPGYTVQGPCAPNRPPTSGLRARIDAGRAQMADLDGRIRSLKAEIEPLDQTMAGIKAELDELDRQREAGLNIDAEDYNSKVGSYNSALERARDYRAQYNAAVNEYNTLLTDDHAMVAQYNSGQR